jgi:hypothetical protein
MVFKVALNPSVPFFEINQNYPSPTFLMKIKPFSHLRPNNKKRLIFH